MARVDIQNRTNEFQAILKQAEKQRNQSQKLGAAQRQSLLTSDQKAAANGSLSPQKQRSEFAKQAGQVSQGLSHTMAKLQRLAQLARRKTLFDDRPVEINELTYIIKQDLARLDSQIKQLQQLSAKQHGIKPPPADHTGQHETNVTFILREKLADATSSFKDTLELRTKNLAASRSRTDQFMSTVQSHSNPTSLNPSRTDSPLYGPDQQRANGKPYSLTAGAQSDILSLDMPSQGSSALQKAAPMGMAQLQMMEEGSNTYIQERGQAIENIERTMTELGSIFTQLATMVSEQGEQIQRIDADTEMVVENVEGAQRELLKYWNRMSGNRMLVAKMFGVLMIFFLLWVLIAG